MVLLSVHCFYPGYFIYTLIYFYNLNKISLSSYHCSSKEFLFAIEVNIITRILQREMGTRILFGQVSDAICDFCYDNISISFMEFSFLSSKAGVLKNMIKLFWFPDEIFALTPCLVLMVSSLLWMEIWEPNKLKALDT